MTRYLILFFFVLSTAAAEPPRSEGAFSFNFDQADQVSSTAVSAARRAGVAQASADIATGKFWIVVYGEPIPEPIPPFVPRDAETGFAFWRLHDCTATAAFKAQVEAYNATMRHWHAEHSKHPNT